MKKLTVGMRVLVNMPGFSEHLAEGEIIREIRSPGITFDLKGIRYTSNVAYVVDIDEVGFVHPMTGDPLMYPPEFLTPLPPRIKIQEKSSWKDFDKMIESLTGERFYSNNIIGINE